jgi:hypothetical protein
MDDRTAAQAATGWWWGTNRPGGTFYAGRAHVVHPSQPKFALCGMPVSDSWELRPPTPEHLCPECCVLAMAASYPPFHPPQGLPLPRRSATTGSSVATAEQTARLPALSAYDDP